MRWTLITIFVFFSGLYFFSGVGIQNSGDAPQYELTKSIVDNHSFYLDKDAQFVWPDIGIIDGNTISGRSPGESFLGIPFYFVASKLNNILTLPYNGQRSGITGTSGIEAASSIGVAIFGSLSVVLICLLGHFFTSNRVAQVLPGVMFGFGSLIWKYSSVFNRHSYHVFFILLATYGLLSFRANHSKWQLSSLLVGLGTGGAYFVEPTSVFFILAIYFCLTYILLRRKKSDIKSFFKIFGIISTLILIINLPVFYYNQTVFGAFYKNGWEHQVRNTWISDFTVAFSSPLISSVGTNLFSPNKPISTNALSEKLKDTKIGSEQSYSFAIKYPYKGIFFQSPYLWLILLPLFWNKGGTKNKPILYLIFFAFTANILQFLYLVYYSPNSYDTRFFITFVALLTPPISIVFDKIFSHKSCLFRWICGLTVLILFLLSFYNNWVSSLENYAPHLTGEKRIELSLLLSKPTLTKILSESFPNFYNYKIWLVYQIIFGVIFTFLNKTFNKFGKLTNSKS